MGGGLVDSGRQEFMIQGNSRTEVRCIQYILYVKYCTYCTYPLHNMQKRDMQQLHKGAWLRDLASLDTKLLVQASLGGSSF